MSIQEALDSSEMLDEILAELHEPNDKAFYANVYIIFGVVYNTRENDVWMNTIRYSKFKYLPNIIDMLKSLHTVANEEVNVEGEREEPCAMYSHIITKSYIIPILKQYEIQWEYVGSMSENVNIITILSMGVEEVSSGTLELEYDINIVLRDVYVVESADENKDGHNNFMIRPSSLGNGLLELHTITGKQYDDCWKPFIVSGGKTSVLSSEKLIDHYFQLLRFLTAVLNTKSISNILKDCKHDSNEDVVKESDGSCSVCKSNISTADVTWNYAGRSGPAVHYMSKVEGDNGSMIVTQDSSIALKCIQWPTAATAWIQRAKSSAISKDVIKKVLEDGCHVVPKFQDSDKSDGTEEGACNNAATKIEWRYSFSVAEKTIMCSLKEVQRYSYIVFKLLFAFHLKVDSIITGYIAKTVFLFHIEKYPPAEWTIKLLPLRIKEMLQKCAVCFEQKYCSHYFLSNCNIVTELGDELCQNLLKSYEDLEKKLFTLPTDDTNKEGGEGEGEGEGEEKEENQNQLHNSVTVTDPSYLWKRPISFKPKFVWLDILSKTVLVSAVIPRHVPSQAKFLKFLDPENHPIEFTSAVIYLVYADKYHNIKLTVPEQYRCKQVCKDLKVLHNVVGLKIEDVEKEFNIEIQYLAMQDWIVDRLTDFLFENPLFEYEIS